MDPNETLKRIREKINELNAWLDASDAQTLIHYERGAELGAELARLVNGLDEWLSKQGFLPRPWERGA